MPRKPPTQPDDDPEEDEWGGSDADSDADSDDIAPPAPPVTRHTDKPTPPPESVAALGPPPTDAMAGAKWAYQVHLRLAHDVFINPNLSSETRERRVSKLLAGAAKHMTDAMRYEVKQAIEQDRQAMEAKKRGRAAAKMTKRRPDAEGAKVIPIRRDG